MIFYSLEVQNVNKAFLYVGSRYNMPLLIAFNVKMFSKRKLKAPAYWHESKTILLTGLIEVKLSRCTCVFHLPRNADTHVQDITSKERIKTTILVLMQSQKQCHLMRNNNQLIQTGTRNVIFVSVFTRLIIQKWGSDSELRHY